MYFNIKYPNVVVKSIIPNQTGGGGGGVIVLTLFIWRDTLKVSVSFRTQSHFYKDICNPIHSNSRAFSLLLEETLPCWPLPLISGHTVPGASEELGQIMPSCLWLLWCPLSCSNIPSAVFETRDIANPSIFSLLDSLDYVLEGQSNQSTVKC